MKIQTCIFLMALSMLIGQSCGRTLYQPNMQNVPMMKEKNEFRSNLALNNFQASYAISDKIGVMVNGQIDQIKETINRKATSYPNEVGGGYRYNTSEDDNSKRKYIEAGLGYFKPLGPSFVFDTYTGSGIGTLSFDNEDHIGRDKFSTKFAQFFIQPSIGLSSDHFEFAYSLRFVNLHFFDGDTSEYEYDPSSARSKDLSNINKSSYNFIEQAFTLRAGYKRVKVQLQFQTVRQVWSEKIKFVPLDLSLGIHINIANRYNKS